MIKVSPRLLSGELCELEIPAQSQTVGEMCTAFARKFSAARYSINVAYGGKLLPPETPLSSLSFDSEKRPVIFDGNIDIGRIGRESDMPRYADEYRFIEDPLYDENDANAFRQIGVNVPPLGDRPLTFGPQIGLPDLMGALGRSMPPNGPRMFDVELMDIMDEGDDIPSDVLDPDPPLEEEEEDYSDYGDMPRPSMHSIASDNLMNLLMGMRVLTGAGEDPRAGLLEVLEGTRDFLEGARLTGPPPGEGGRDQMPQFAMPEMPEENRREIEEIIGMGFDPGLVVQVYEACDRNSEQTISCLMSMT